MLASGRRSLYLWDHEIVNGVSMLLKVWFTPKIVYTGCVTAAVEILSNGRF